MGTSLPGRLYWSLYKLDDWIFSFVWDILCIRCNYTGKDLTVIIMFNWAIRRPKHMDTADLVSILVLVIVIKP